MQYWIRQNGEKQGPLAVWDVYEKIDSKELSRDELVWHDGLSSWVKAEELFLDRFKELEVKELKIEGSETPPPLPQAVADSASKPFWWRRAFAKFLDLILAQLIFFALINLLKIPLVPESNTSWVIIFQVLPWIFIESYLLQKYGTTPGKYFMGLSVSSISGEKISARTALIRTLYSWGVGMAFGLNPICLFSALCCYFVSLPMNRFSWDYRCQTKVEGTQSLSVGKIFGFVGLFLILMATFPRILPSDYKAQAEQEAVKLIKALNLPTK